MTGDARHVRLRLRPQIARALEEVAAARALTVTRLCEHVVATSLDCGPLPAGRVPMPFGIDVSVAIPPNLWSVAAALAKNADMTIGQLFRHIVERYAAAREPVLPSATASWSVRAAITSGSARAARC